jgi:hypothetical protein
MHTLLAYIFYYIGDIVCRIPTEWAYKLYQYSMAQSVRHDDLGGNKIWKEPE